MKPKPKATRGYQKKIPPEIETQQEPETEPEPEPKLEGTKTRGRTGTRGGNITKTR